MTPLLNLVLGFVDEAQAGMASGVISTVQQVGAALAGGDGAALATGGSAVAPAGRYAAAFVAGMLCNLAAALLVCGLLAILARTRRTAD